MPHDYQKKSQEYKNTFNEEGKRKKDFKYIAAIGPIAVSSPAVKNRTKIPSGQTTLAAATDNAGSMTLRTPGSVRGYTLDVTADGGILGSLAQGISSETPDQPFPFYFKSIDILSVGVGLGSLVGDLQFSISEIATFQATLSDLRESVSPVLFTKHYFGRSETVKVYRYTDRKINMSFTVYAPSFAGLQHVKERINFLVKNCYPSYESESSQTDLLGKVGGLLGLNNSVSQKRYKEPPIMLMTVGDLFVDLPGIIETLDIEWVGETNRWEMEPGARMPQIAKINMSFIVLHRKMPEKSVGSDFYPDLDVDDLYATQGEGGSFARGQKSQAINTILKGLGGQGSTVNKVNQLLSQIESLKDLKDL